ncbi:unnamed protein product [Rangifer tarandus platyrhynchus]|uniref:Uncharacterized protein n=1 Tax=Rangifer tarandus platyrhynchus TaxID=3082113 RepID=A0ABN8YTN0_RANTA|nr:unnamed protein product [Rangifer tarandus platyrhynchus]
MYFSTSPICSILQPQADGAETFAERRDFRRSLGPRFRRRQAAACALSARGQDAEEGHGSADFSGSRAFAFAENGSASLVRSRCGTGERPPVSGLPFMVRKRRT